MAEIKEVIKGVARCNKGEPLSSFKMTYDSDANQIEPVYYWLLDFMQDAGIKVEKIVDNFNAAPGSGQFNEMGQKATKMQEEGMKILGAINQVVKSVLQLIYDLKEFEIRLKAYEKAKSEDAKQKEEGMLALKQIWLDNVDMKRGRGSIHQMSYEMGFTTLREVFLMANSVKNLEEMSSKAGGEVTNDSVKRILIPRISEFLDWVKISESELTKRFTIEKSYLRSQVETMKLYTKWASPYLKAAEQLRMKGFETDAALVNAFSTSMFNIVLLGKHGAVSIQKEENLKKSFGNYNLKKQICPVYLISIKYRGHLGQRVTQKGDYAYGFGGRFDITFDSFALSLEEIDLAKKKFDESSVDEGLKFLNENTQVSLNQMKDDLDHFLDEGKDKKKEEAEKKKKEDDTNPFSALFDMFKGVAKKEEKKDIKNIGDIKEDNFVEQAVRKVAVDKAIKMLYTIYDIYKKAHAMASAPEGFDNGDK